MSHILIAVESSLLVGAVQNKLLWWQQLNKLGQQPRPRAKSSEGKLTVLVHICMTYLLAGTAGAKLLTLSRLTCWPGWFRASSVRTSQVKRSLEESHSLFWFTTELTTAVSGSVSCGCEQLTFDVTVDDLILVEVGQTSEQLFCVVDYHTFFKGTILVQ